MLFAIQYVLYRITREDIDIANETKWKFGPFCWFVFSIYRRLAKTEFKDA